MIRSALLVHILLLSLVAVGCGGGLNREQQALFDAGSRRFDTARALIAQGELDAATDVLLPLWLESTDPLAPSGTFFYANMTGTVGSLVSSYPPARARFAPWRDPLEECVLAGKATARQEHLWLEYTQAAGEGAALVAYAERFQADPARMERLTGYGDRAFDRLVELGRWDLAGRLYADPVNRIYYEDPRPAGVKALEGVGLAMAVVVAAPVEVLGDGMTSGPKGGPTRDDRERYARLRLRRAATMGAALVAAGRSLEARELYRRAEERVGSAAAEAEFSAAAARAGVASPGGGGVAAPPAAPAGPAPGGG